MFSKKLEYELIIEGMHCQHCAKKVEESLSKIKGVKKVLVDVETGKTIILSKTEVDNSAIKTAVENLGYSIKQPEEL